MGSHCLRQPTIRVAWRPNHSMPKSIMHDHDLETYINYWYIPLFSLQYSQKLQELYGDGKKIQGLRVLGRGPTDHPRRAMQGHLQHRREIHPRDGARDGEVQDEGSPPGSRLLHALQCDLDGEVPLPTSLSRPEPSIGVCLWLCESCFHEVPLLE